ncbi:MAG: crossover junction endodeoxyribonuclease RuvC [Patescibacteria group bacterium]|nr:crossover junction endodeoxyribonuclease RuvC [Patescibacteria group bacterium]
MLILGVDPGTARLGWGTIIDKNNQQTVGEFGCLETKSTLPESQRLLHLFQGLTKLLKKFRPDAVAVEDLFFFKNQKTVIKISQARGVILVASALLGLPVFSYTPLQVKQAVTGYGRADKNQVQQMTKNILKLESIPQPDDAADAIAVAITHSFSQKLKSKLQ